MRAGVSKRVGISVGRGDVAAEDESVDDSGEQSPIGEYLHPPEKDSFEPILTCPTV